MFVDDGLNSTVAKFATIFFGFGPESFFFWTKIPCVAIFYCLGWLVGWLRFGTTFRDVCHPKKITVPLATTAIIVGNNRKKPVETLDRLLWRAVDRLIWRADKASQLAARTFVASSPCSAIPARSCPGPVRYPWGSIVEFEVPPDETPGLMTLHPHNTNVLQSITYAKSPYPHDRSNTGQKN